MHRCVSVILYEYTNNSYRRKYSREDVSKAIDNLITSGRVKAVDCDGLDTELFINE